MTFPNATGDISPVEFPILIGDFLLPAGWSVEVDDTKGVMLTFSFDSIEFHCLHLEAAILISVI